MQTLMRILNGLLTIYTLLLFIRILLSWVRGINLGRAAEILYAITDPFLNFFRRFRFLVMANIDFSPILGFIFLSILLNITGSLAVQERVLFSSILRIILASIWGFIEFLLILLIIIGIIRLVMYLMRTSSYGPVAMYLDRIMEPIMELVRRTFFRRTFIAQNRLAGITVLFLVLLLVAAGFLVNLLAAGIARIPF